MRIEGRPHPEEPLPVEHIHLRDLYPDCGALMSTEQVEGIDPEGNPCEGTLIFVYDLPPGRILKKEDC